MTARPGYVRYAAALALAGAACAPAEPEEPSWAEDVRPILLANCARCHSPPPIQAAPVGFRLDVYEDTELDDGTELQGAEALADNVAARATAETMPPEFPLTDRQQNILSTWAKMGAPKGPPAEGNRPPGMELRRALPESRSGDTVVIQYAIDDPDFDFVTGRLLAQGDGDDIVITRELHSGWGEVSWDVSDLGGQSFTLVASLDDGSVTEQVALGSVTIGSLARP